MSNHTFTVIGASIIKNIIEQHPHEIYNIVKDTYLAHGAGKTINPNSYFMRFPNHPQSRIIALPAALTENNPIAGIKWIGSNPDNIHHGIERASATIILNDVS